MSELSTRTDELGKNPVTVFSPTALIAQHSDFWSYYLEKYSVLKESRKQEDPNILIFDGTIDLKVFCQYGRELGALLTK